MFPRKWPKRNGSPKPKSYAPFRSAMEKRVSQLLSKLYDYEPKKSKKEYLVPHKYNPDFVHPNHPHVLLEVKGYFRTSQEAAKYIWIRKCNPDLEIIFIFGNANKKCHPNCRPRKDGSVLTLREWCDNNEFLFYTEKALPEEVVKGKLTQEWIQSERKKRGFKC